MQVEGVPESGVDPEEGVGHNDFGQRVVLWLQGRDRLARKSLRHIVEDSIDDAWIFIRASGKNQPIYGELVVV